MDAGQLNRIQKRAEAYFNELDAEGCAAMLWAMRAKGLDVSCHPSPRTDRQIAGSATFAKKVSHISNQVASFSK